jgi:hypothetical protein
MNNRASSSCSDGSEEIVSRARVRDPSTRPIAPTNGRRSISSAASAQQAAVSPDGTWARLGVRRSGDGCVESGARVGSDDAGTKVDLMDARRICSSADKPKRRWPPTYPGTHTWSSGHSDTGSGGNQCCRNDGSFRRRRDGHSWPCACRRRQPVASPHFLGVFEPATRRLTAAAVHGDHSRPTAMKIQTRVAYGDDVHGHQPAVNDGRQRCFSRVASQPMSQTDDSF